MNGCIAILVLMPGGLVRPAQPMTAEERRQYLQQLLQILPEVKSFRAWLEKTGELPGPLRFLNGAPVCTPQEWNVRRAEIKGLWIGNHSNKARYRTAAS